MSMGATAGVGGTGAAVGAPTVKRPAQQARVSRSGSGSGGGAAVGCGTDGGDRRADVAGVPLARGAAARRSMPPGARDAPAAIASSSASTRNGSSGLASQARAPSGRLLPTNKVSASRSVASTSCTEGSWSASATTQSASARIGPIS